jgi:chromosomal replication initiation ATPase DnaA
MGAPSLEEIIKVVEEAKGEKWSDFRDRHGDWGRDLVFYLGRKGWAMRLKELGAAAGGIDEVAVSMAARRVPMRAKRDRALAKALEECKQKLQMLNV